MKSDPDIQLVARARRAATRRPGRGPVSWRTFRRDRFKANIRHPLGCLRRRHRCGDCKTRRKNDAEAKQLRRMATRTGG